MLNKRYIPIDYGWAHATLIHSLFPPNKSMLGARLSLFCYTQLQRVGSRLISSLGPHRHVKGETPHPRLRSEHAFRSFAMLNREESAFARCRGFTLHRFVPYRNHAYEANCFPTINKILQKTCTKLMLQKCAGTPRLENRAGTPC